ncbi:MAG: hypothetical protein RR409_16325 [Clostridium sp.]
MRIFIYRSSLYKIGKTVRVSINKSGEIVGFTNFIEYPHKPVIKFKDGTIIDTYRK